MRIAIVGAGAVGGYYGARLAQHGGDVHFLFRSDYEHVRDHGIEVRSVDGDFALSPARVHAYHNVKKMPRADLVLVTLKTTANDQLPRLVPPLIHDHTIVLTLQNGLGNENALAQHIGADRVIGGMAFVCINRVSPGVLEHTERGIIKVGELSPGVTQRVRAIVELFTRANINAEPIEDLRRGRWEKLVWNIPFNGLGALHDATTDRLLATPQGEALVRAVMAEVVAAAAGNGVALDPDVIDRMIEVTRPIPAYRTSTQVDRQLGRPMEIEAMFGEPFRAAGRAGVLTPRLHHLYDALTRLNASQPDSSKFARLY
jgi:2-dehydropantoate 2-reductase